MMVTIKVKKALADVKLSNNMTPRHALTSSRIEELEASAIPISPII